MNGFGTQGTACCAEGRIFFVLAAEFLFFCIGSVSVVLAATFFVLGCCLGCLF
jgi:hypothetical protein